MAKIAPTPFNSILIANRGEIACRIIRTAKSMGLKTIAVYSEADKNTPHVKMADQAVNIGPAPVGESYLVIEKILDAAKQTGAQAIHPGYGFLSENSAFAKACKSAGIVFIGPEPDAIDLMGDKAKSKRRMIKAGVPCVPGYQGEKQDDKILIKESKTIGFPIMVKAAAGGGGRGMRFVNDPKLLPDAIKDARSEALNAFGSDILILERAVQQPRHVEIQVFADKFGNTIHLGERDCSVQRRHQKVLEEAPCPIMTPKLRKTMGTAAVKAAKDIGYIGAGTVEFMLDSSGEFYFLEMNTRLQVEHPVTEMVTGFDLVALQIQVARGEKLGLTQGDITLNGHAIEARLYAEDPAQDFLPATGPIRLWEPARGDGIRIDSGIENGGEVSPFYDPMIAKVIAYGDTREDARLKLINALKDTVLFGVKSNKAFLVDALAHPVFAKGGVTTAFIEENYDQNDLTLPTIADHGAIAGAITQYILARNENLDRALPLPRDLMNWSSATKISTPFKYDELNIVITPQRGSDYIANLEGRDYNVSVIEFDSSQIRLSINGDRLYAQYLKSGPASLDIALEANTYTLTNSLGVIASMKDVAGAGTVIAPMHGALLEVFVKTGDKVSKGERLAILEAMKMQHEILAEIDGIITAVHVEAGSQIVTDTLMIDIEVKG